ncbi:unnamed protein product [Durusdinium trenchii]|uniref:Uncharacterized protein n=2 Tax=Durusdinium trenchii TaxID=1381693 RepID=A0ABP0JW00_9DINO
MCDAGTQRKAQNVWNGWLDERDLAPGEIISNWLKRHTQRGLSLAAEYAQAGYDRALERADVAWKARSLLDSGTPAHEAITVKQQCDRVVAADGALCQMLRDLSSQYTEEARFPKDVESGKAIGLWALRYGQAAEALGPVPRAPERSAVEQDALTLQQLREAQSHVATKLLGTPPVQTPKGITGYAPPSGPSRTESAKTKAQEQVQQLLRKLFDLHDLKANGVLEEEELIKMNEKVALLHYGKEKTDKNAIREKFRGVFREQLDPEGRPVPFTVFRDYMQGVLNGVDADPSAQVMMVEQFIAEAETARQAFRIPSLASESDQFVMPQAALPKKDAPGGRPSTLADRIAQEAAQPGGSLPVGRQPESEPQLAAERTAATFGPESSSKPEAPQDAASVPFQKGDKLQVWSNSKNSWRDGEVIEAFPKACKAEGFAVPAGTIKVTFDEKTIKWVMPGQAASLLRRCPDA